MAKGVTTAYTAHRLAALTAVPFSSMNRSRLYYRFKDLASIEKLGGTDLKALPPPRLTLYFPNRIIIISGMHSTIIVSLKDIPAPLTIGGSCKGVKRCSRTRSRITRLVKAPGRHIRAGIIFLYLFIYLLPEFLTAFARRKFSPTTSTTTANDYYTNAPCPRGHCIDWLRAAT
jgi:hypothetical protein